MVRYHALEQNPSGDKIIHVGIGTPNKLLTNVLSKKNPDKSIPSALTKSVAANNSHGELLANQFNRSKRAATSQSRRQCDRTAQNSSVLSPKPIHVTLSNNKELLCCFRRVKPGKSHTTGSLICAKPTRRRDQSTTLHHIKVHKFNIITNQVFQT
jgi:hypothetical protein